MGHSLEFDQMVVAAVCVCECACKKERERERREGCRVAVEKGT